MSYDSESDDYDSEEDPFWNSEIYDGKKNVAVIIIDNGPKMFIKSENAEHSPFKICLLSLFEMLDGMLLNTYKRNVSINLLQDEDFSISKLEDNLVDTAKNILDLTKTSEADLKQRYERLKPPNLQNVLMESVKQVYRLNNVSPYIVIMTNDDDPESGDSQAYLGAINVVNDSFSEKNVKLIVLPLSYKFNYAPIYKELLKAANNDDLDIDMFEDTYDNPTDLVEILRQVVKDKVRVHRFMFNVYENGGRVLNMWVELRYLVKVRNLYHNVKISRVTNNEVTEDYVHKDRIDFQKKWIDIGNGEKLFVERDEPMKLMMPYGFRLLYVNDKQTSMHRLQKTSFILQADDVQKGENKKELFKDMWMYCVEKKKVLVCGFSLPRGNSVPQLVELSPDRFLSKPCFIGTYLIHEDECKLEVEPKTDYERNLHIPVNDSLVDAFCNVIDKLKVTYNPNDWVDEALERKSKMIKEHLLEAELSKMVKAFPTDFSITEKLGECGAEVEYLLEAAKEVSQPATRGTKRKKQ